MITINNRIRLLVVLTTLLLGLAACQEKSPVSDFNGETETPEEAMVEAAAEAGDIERTIALADSFVNLNKMSSVRGDFYKAMACDRKNNYPAMAEHLKRIIKAYEDGTDEHPLFYSRATGKAISSATSANVSCL